MEKGQFGKFSIPEKELDNIREKVIKNGGTKEDAEAAVLGHMVKIAKANVRLEERRDEDDVAA